MKSINNEPSQPQAHKRTTQEYKNIFDGIWHTLTNYLGTVTARSIVDRARYKAMLNEPVLKLLDITDDGYNLSGFLARYDKLNFSEYHKALESVIDALRETLRRLALDEPLKEIDKIIASNT